MRELMCTTCGDAWELGAIRGVPQDFGLVASVLLHCPSCTDGVLPAATQAALKEFYLTFKEDVESASRNFGGALQIAEMMADLQKS